MELPHSPFPHVDFKVVDESDPEDTGVWCRVVQQPADGRWLLQKKTGRSMIAVGQALFPNPRMAMSWARRRWAIDRDLEIAA